MSSAPSDFLDGFLGLDKESPIDILETKRSYLIRAKSGTQIRASASAYRLLQSVNSGQSLTDLAVEINRVNPEANITTAQLEQAYQNLASKLAAIEERASKFKLPWAFWIKVRLLPSKLVQQISSVLSILYQPYVCLALLLGIALGVFSLSRHVALTASDSTLWWGYTWYLLSLMFHELGHSSACAKFGAPPSDIGFTIYLIYPAFYSDVSSAWQLSRWQRVAVDLGGNYFQCLAAAVFTLGFKLSGFPSLRIAGLMILYTCIFSLNPFFKFDGYWVAADMLGVANLSSQPARIGKHYLDKFLGRETSPLPWPRSIAMILLCYSLVTTSVWVYFVWKLVPLMRDRVVMLNRELTVVFNRAMIGQMPHWSDFKPILLSIPLLLICVIMIWGILVRSYRSIAVRLKDSKPPATTGAGITGEAL